MEAKPEKNARDLMPNDPADLSVLQQRAAEIAHAFEQSLDADLVSYVQVELGEGVYYGFDVDLIEQMISSRRVTEVPGCGMHIYGVVNWRGQLITVVELGNFFKVTSQKPKQEREILIIRRRSTLVGVVVDSVVGTEHYDAAQLQTDVHFGAGVESRYIKGVYQGRVMILDLDSILSDRRLIIDDSIKSM